jgi:hypothetical protein
VQSLLGGEKGEFLDHIMLSYSIRTLNLYVMVFYFISKVNMKIRKCLTVHLRPGIYWYIMVDVISVIL